jgi:hypothetical protein
MPVFYPVPLESEYWTSSPDERVPRLSTRTREAHHHRSTGIRASLRHARSRTTAAGRRQKALLKVIQTCQPTVRFHIFRIKRR